MNMLESPRIISSPNQSKIVKDIFIITDEGQEIDWFDTVEEAQDYLIEKLHMFGKLYVTYEEITTYTINYQDNKEV